jgi:hypothetical protein
MKLIIQVITDIETQNFTSKFAVTVFVVIFHKMPDILFSLTNCEKFKANAVKYCTDFIFNNLVIHSQQGNSRNPKTHQANFPKINLLPDGIGGIMGLDRTFSTAISPVKKQQRSTCQYLAYPCKCP